MCCFFSFRVSADDARSWKTSGSMEAITTEDNGGLQGISSLLLLIDRSSDDYNRLYGSSVLFHSRLER